MFNWGFNLSCSKINMDNILRFKCLHNNTVVQEYVSDHNPVIYVSPLGERFCSWNILTKKELIYVPNTIEQYFNNGFSEKETEGEYLQRLNKIIKVLKELKDIHGISFFCLQEAPSIPLFRQELAKAFNLNESTLEISHNITRGVAPFGEELFFTTNPLNVIINTTNENKHMISVINRERFQSFIITINQTTIRLANFHADFKVQEQTKADISVFANLGYIIAGDFNLIREPLTPYETNLKYTQANLFNNIGTLDGIIDGRWMKDRLSYILCKFRLC